MTETGRFKVRFEQFFAAPRAAVFDFFSDHERLGKVLGVAMKRSSAGNVPAEPNGLGSVRKVRALPLTPWFDETITRFERPSVIEYRVTRGSPIKNHFGRMVFTDEAGGTRLVYTISFDPRIPFTGRLIANMLNSGWQRGAPRAVAATAQKTAA